ncbi:MAG TPA: VTC domain-containing protein [Anaerolineae bacterium]|nr:VTC domain-containing protein [Anaerolineae bacterium]
MSQTEAVLRLHPAGLRRVYAGRWVHSLYWDTRRMDFYEANVMGSAEREKIRWRWYGEGSLGDVIEPSLERKFKKGLLGGKERIRLAWQPDMGQTWGAIYKEMLAQVPVGWRGVLWRAPQAVCYVRYYRDYFVSGDGQVRVTVDRDLVAYDQRFGGRPQAVRAVPLAGWTVVEVKGEAAAGEAVMAVAGGLPWPRVQHSKYVRAVMGSG